MDVDLAFVVGGAASKEIAVSHGRFECRRSPEIERLGGLHVIVPVKENGWLTGSFQGFRIYERVQVCRNDFDLLKSGGTKILRDPARAALDIGLVLALGADARDAQKLAQFSQMLVALTFDKFSKVHKGPSGDMSPFK